MLPSTGGGIPAVDLCEGGGGGRSKSEEQNGLTKVKEVKVERGGANKDESDSQSDSLHNGTIPVHPNLIQISAPSPPSYTGSQWWSPSLVFSPPPFISSTHFSIRQREIPERFASF